MRNPNLLEFYNVGIRYGVEREVLSDLNFAIPRGSYHFITGRSGAGKTTFLRLAYLAHRPDRGDIRILGVDLRRIQRPERQRLRTHIGVVFQDFRLLNHLSVFDNVALPLRIRKHHGTLKETDADIRKRVMHQLTVVGMQDYASVSPVTLSGGQQQNIAICRAVISQPRLLLADEPTGNIDDQMAMRILGLFENLHSEFGSTILVATHSRTVIESYPHPLIVLNEGRARLIKR